MLVNSALTTLVVVLYVYVDFSSAARAEEALLLEKLSDYAGCIQRTGRFFSPRWQ